MLQVLIFSGDTITNTPKNNVLPATLAFFIPVKWTPKINNHTVLTLSSWNTRQFANDFSTISSPHQSVAKASDFTIEQTPDLSLSPPSLLTLPVSHLDHYNLITSSLQIFAL